MYNKQYHRNYYEKNKDKIKNKSITTYRKTHIVKSVEDKFKEKLKNKHGDKYTLLESYINGETNVLFRCNICNYEWRPKPTKLLHDTNCPNCARIKKTTKKEVFIKKLNDVHHNSITLLDEFINYQTKVNVKCNICSHTWLTKATHLIHSTSSCPKCVNKILHDNQTKSHQQFSIDVYNIHKDTLTIEEKYINAKTKIKIRCNVCNNSWEIIPYSLLQGVGCPICKQSKGEQMIEHYLKNNIINYIRQYKYGDCRYKQPLFFDFAIFKNDKFIGLIEFDGIQHFKPVEYFGGLKELKENKKRDNIKNSYCKINDIKLLRIPYNKIKNIDKLISNFILEN